MTRRQLSIALGATLAVQAALFGVLIERSGTAHTAVWLYCLALPASALATWLLARCRLPHRQAVLVILGASAVFQILALTHSPTTSDDDYRYIWDAKVQLAGIDPYRYAPDAPQLTHLRDTFLFPATSAPTSSCPHPITGGCSAINRPGVHTIYPPVAEAAFVIMRVVSFGDHGQQLPIQISGALGVLAIAWLLARRVQARGQPPWTVALWAWSPLPIIEYSNAGHIDWLGILFVVLGLGAATARRSGLAGLLVGAAIATKLYPAIVLPALLRRRPGVVLGAAVGLVALSYVPHVLAVGKAVIGYLPGYLQEEKYTSGGRLLLLGYVLPRPYDTAVGVLLLAVVAVAVYRRADPAHPEQGTVVMMGAALLIATPAYGWYAGLLLALVVMSGSLEWLPVALAPTLVYLIRLDAGGATAQCRIIYAAAALSTAVILAVRRRRRPARRELAVIG
jgi:alpha-1,2-mannosyltransferase